jgi:hypothetical protein
MHPVYTQCHVGVVAGEGVVDTEMYTLVYQSGQPSIVVCCQENMNHSRICSHGSWPTDRWSCLHDPTEISLVNREGCVSQVSSVSIPFRQSGRVEFFLSIDIRPLQCGMEIRHVCNP